MIEEIRIQKYKSIKDLTFDFNTPLTALIGKTGAGKTNVLEAIYLACSLGFSGVIPQSYQSEIPRGFSVCFTLTVRKKTCWYQFRFLFKKDRHFIQDSFTIKDGRKKIELFAKRDPFTVKFYNNSKLIYIPAENSGLSMVKKMIVMPELPEEFSGLSSHVNEIAGVILDFSKIQLFRAPSQLNPALFLVKDFDLWKHNQHLVSDDLQFSFELYDLFKNKPKQFAQFCRHLKKLDLIDNIQASELTATDDTGQEYHCLVWRFQLHSQAFPFRALSQGTQRVIHILFHIYTRQSSLMLIQQLESGLHYALLMDTLKMLKGYALENKVLFSSYSDHMFNELQPEQMIYLVNKKNITKARRLKSRHMGPLLSDLSAKSKTPEETSKFLTIKYRGRRLLG